MIKSIIGSVHQRRYYNIMARVKNNINQEKKLEIENIECEYFYKF